MAADKLDSSSWQKAAVIPGSPVLWKEQAVTPCWPAAVCCAGRGLLQRCVHAAANQQLGVELVCWSEGSCVLQGYVDLISAGQPCMGEHWAPVWIRNWGPKINQVHISRQAAGSLKLWLCLQPLCWV